MLKYSSFHISVSLALAFCAMLASPLASACCPRDGNGSPKAASGLGESFPVATDLAPDAAWQVYEFERDGIRYVQVNDQRGVVRAAVGRIGGTFWVLPIGDDADRVSVPGDSAPSGKIKTIYRSSEVEVLLYQDGTGDRWLVRSSPAV